MRRMLAGVAVLAGLVLGSDVVAQPPQNLLPQPRINTVFPCGARAGTTVEVAVSGTDLDDATGLVFSHASIKSEPVAPTEKPDPKKEPKKTPGMGRRQPAALVTIKFHIIVSADVPVGQYDVRIVNRFGVSNPRAFVVDD